MADRDRDDKPRKEGEGVPVDEQLEREAERRAPFTQQLGRIVMLVAALVFAAFALANAQSVDFSWIFGKTEVGSDGGGVPLILLLVAAFALGATVGLIAGIRRRRRP